VRFDLGEACYRDPVKMGHCNWWNYYFEPIDQNPNSKPSRRLNEADLSKVRINRKKGNKLIRKHIILRKDVAKLINKFYIKHMAKHKTIGVHMRGTDSYLWLKKNKERSLYNINEVIKQLKPICGEYDKIFIASDQHQYVQKIKKHFGPNKVIVTNAVRSKTRTNVHNDDRISGYQKGLEALMDCILLSKCDYLICSSSNLSKTALYYNPDIQHKKLIGNR
jgi:hypothetical protein